MLWENGGRVTIRDNIWYSHYEQEGGNSIEFVRKYYNLSYQDAVQMLLDERIEPLSVTVKQQKQKKPFELPSRNDTMRQVFAYLLNSRFLDRDVVKHFVHEGLIYESKEMHKGKEIHNCVFLGIDKDGIPRHAHKRGTYTLGDGFKGNVDSCDAEYSFHHTGKSNKLFVFEAPIDMLSYISLHKENWQDHSYVSLCSVADHAMFRMLKDNIQINKIYLCLDNDEEGIQSDWRIRNNLKEQGYTDVSFIRPKYKDWNEILKAKNGIEPLPAVPNKFLTKMREMIRDIVPVVVDSKPMLYPYRTIQADYERLTASSTYEQMAKNANLLAKDSLRKINSLIKLTDKELASGILEQYLPHTDKACFENKQKDIRDDMNIVEKLFGNNQIRISSIVEEDVKKLYKLACNCLRLQSHIEMEESPNFINEEERSDVEWSFLQA